MEHSRLIAYRLERQLGSGTFGEVSLVKRLTDNVSQQYLMDNEELFALKRLKARPGDVNYDLHVRYFKREANILMALKHPFIVSCHGYFIENDSH